MNDIYANMNDALAMAYAQRRAEESYDKLAQLKADILAAEQAMAWISALCWWLDRCAAGWWNSANDSALDMERARTGRAWDRHNSYTSDRAAEWSKLLP